MKEETIVNKLLTPFLREGWRCWEYGRVIYNAAQLGVTVCMAVTHWPESRFFTANPGSFLACALISNLLYSLCYLAEPLIRLIPGAKNGVVFRANLFALGTTLACFLTGAALEIIVFSDPNVD